jgi:hypothetical protein
MLLRDYPLMSRFGVPNWPPTWTWIDGLADRHPKGEVGILRAVLLSKIEANKCFLLIFHEHSSYLGCLLFDDAVFCSQMINLLRNYCNRPIAEIGRELAHTL